jgi:hypothetical protein
MAWILSSCAWRLLLVFGFVEHRVAHDLPGPSMTFEERPLVLSQLSQVETA